jgi:hypothetical protein
MADGQDGARGSASVALGRLDGIGTRALVVSRRAPGRPEGAVRARIGMP